MRRRGWGSLFAFAFAFAGAATSADVDPQLLLSRVRAKVAWNAKQMPRYLCRQKIERRQFVVDSKVRSCAALVQEKTRRTKFGLRLAADDRANLDVMLAEGGEIFSWPGDGRFGTGHPGDLLSGGMAGSGDFASFVIDIFGIDAVSFHYAGDCESPFCVRFKYEVPLASSHYLLKMAVRDLTVGYTGTFDVDPRTADLLRVVVIPSNLDALLPEICELRTQMTYARSASRTGDYMLPSATEKDLLLSDASYLENRTSYQGCRQFGSESVLKFDDDAPEAPSRADQAAQALSFPPGTQLELGLISKIDSQINSAGDIVEAALTKNVRTAGRVSAPAGTRVRGHLTQMEHLYLPWNQVVIGIRFDRMMLGSIEIPLALAPVGEKDERGRSTFTFNGKRAVLEKKFVSRWVVRAP
jgi:hypothetical protein